MQFAPRIYWTRCIWPHCKKNIKLCAFCFCFILIFVFSSHFKIFWYFEFHYRKNMCCYMQMSSLEKCSWNNFPKIFKLLLRVLIIEILTSFENFQYVDSWPLIVCIEYNLKQHLSKKVCPYFNGGLRTVNLAYLDLKVFCETKRY